MKGAGKFGLIYFDHTNDIYGAFANNSPHAIRIAEITWPTVSHFLLGEQYPEAVQAGLRLTCSVEEALQLVSSHGFFQRPKWDALQDDYLLSALVAKFTQHPELESLLSGTGNHELVYASREDAYYGIGPCGDGHNMLGRLLMRVRRNLGRLHLEYLWGKDLINRLWCAEALVENNPSDAHALSFLADLYSCVGWFEWAAVAARRSLFLSEVNQERNLRALALSLTSLGMDREAIEPLKQLTQLDPADSSYCQWLSTALSNIGKEIPARVYAHRARLLEQKHQDPDDAESEVW